MTIDTIAARNKRIRELEALYDREMRRAVDAEASVAELAAEIERIRWKNVERIDRALDKAEKYARQLAEARAKVAELERTLHRPPLPGGHRMSARIPMVDVAESFPISDTRLIVVCEFGHRMERPRKRRAEWTGYGNQMMSIEDPPPKRVRCRACAPPPAAEPEEETE